MTLPDYSHRARLDPFLGALIGSPKLWTVRTGPKPEDYECVLFEATDDPEVRWLLAPVSTFSDPAGWTYEWARVRRAVP